MSAIYNNKDLWWEIVHWELLLVVAARQARLDDAATKMQALFRGHLVRESIDAEIFGLGGLEDQVHGSLTNDQVSAMYDWHPFAWDWFVNERQAWSDMDTDIGYVSDDDDSLDYSHHSPTGVITLGDWMTGDQMFGSAFSSDVTGDGPFGSFLVMFILVLDKLSSLRGHIGQWRAKDVALKHLAESYPWTFWIVCTLIRHKISRNYYAHAGAKLFGKGYSSDVTGDGPGDDFDLPEFVWSTDEQVLFWIGLAEILTVEQTCALVPKSKNAIQGAYSRLKKEGKVVRLRKSVYMFGKAYSSDVTGDGPGLPRMELSGYNAQLFGARLAVVVDAFDLQVWTYGMRIPAHEWEGASFDHHRDFGSTEMFRDLSALHQLFELWLRTDEYDISIQRWLWDKCVGHLETIEMASFFYDDMMDDQLRELIRDMILLRADPTHMLLPRPESSKFSFVPLF